MTPRTVEIDSDTADVLEAEARSRGMTLPELLRTLAAEDLAPWPRELERMREQGRGPWSPQILAEDARAMAPFEETGEAFVLEDITAWMDSWGKAHELPMPQPRKLEQRQYVDLCAPNRR